MPSVESAAVVTSLPSGWGWNQTEYTVEGQLPAAPGELRLTVSQSVGPDFFRALRVLLLKGRFLNAQDGPQAPPVVVISESMARRNWPDQDPVGKRIKMGRAESSEPWCTIVGVVGDIRQSQFDEEPNPTAYGPFAQLPQTSLALVLRTSGDPLGLAAAARVQAQMVDPEAPAYDLRTLDQLISDDVSGVQFSAGMMLVFGVIALVLAAAGIFALMAYSVVQRTHEIGVRMALGAEHSDVVRLVVGYSMKLTLIGLGIGVASALALTRAISSLLFGVIRMDPLTFAMFTALLAFVAAFAAYIPARRATKVDPMLALRYE